MAALGKVSTGSAPLSIWLRQGATVTRKRTASPTFASPALIWKLAWPLVLVNAGLLFVRRFDYAT